MKVLNSFFRILYSLIILFAAIIMIMMVNNIIGDDVSTLFMDFVNKLENGQIIFTLIFSLIALVSIISVFTGETSDDDPKKGMIMDYEAGNVVLTKDTFENIALSTVKKYGSLKATKVNVELNQEGMTINIYAYVMPDTVVSDVTLKLQKDIKETILKLTTANVEKVNIKIKGIYAQAAKEQSQEQEQE